MCADELYDAYWRNSDFKYTVAAATFVGPFLFIMLVIAFYSVKTFIISNESTSVIVKRTLQNKNLVASVSLGIYVSIYILILDILAVNVVSSCNHEYAPELSRRSLPFNFWVSYITLICDFLACIVFLLVPALYLFIMSLSNHWPWDRVYAGITRIRCCKEDDVNCILSLLLMAPVSCVTSHFGYILLAWLTHPSRSTTTLILYYFLFSYLFIAFRRSYKTGCKLDKIIKKKQLLRNLDNQPSPQGGSASPSPQGIAPVLPQGGGAPALPQEASPQGTDAKKKFKAINLLVFFATLLLGIIYLGVAVIFTMVVYLVPLASEDLFNYLLNVTEFIIIVVSTQYAYKLFAGKKFSLKRSLKYIKNVVNKNGAAATEPSNENVQGIIEESVDFFANKILVPHVRKNEITEGENTRRETLQQ